MIYENEWQNKKKMVLKVFILISTHQPSIEHILVVAYVIKGTHLRLSLAFPLLVHGVSGITISSTAFVNA